MFFDIELKVEILDLKLIKINRYILSVLQYIFYLWYQKCSKKKIVVEYYINLKRYFHYFEVKR